MSFDVTAKLFLKLSPLLFALPAFASDDVTIITADRIKSSMFKSSNDVRIIDQDEIKKTTTRSLPELLKKESDLTITSSGPTGSNASLFLRGTDSSHTLVVLDGIIMNDPGNPNRQFDIGRLSLNNIEKIEILKGSQGLAYGSNAIGGVIVITTKKAKSGKLQGEQYLNYGSFKTFNVGSNLQKQLGKFGFSIGADLQTTEGFSSANDQTVKADRDGSLKGSFDFNTTYTVSDMDSIDALVRFNHSKVDLDKGGGNGFDDPDDTLKEEELYSKLGYNKSWSGNAETKFFYTHTNHYRRTSNFVTSKGIIDSVAINHTYFPMENLTQNINIDWTQERDQAKKSNENLSAFIYHQYDYTSHIFNFGLRIDHNEIFKEYVTYKLAAGKLLPFGLFKLSYSTGFRAPSLNQLFDPLYGNRNLRPETSRSFETALDTEWSDSFKTSVSLFTTIIENRFGYDVVTFRNNNSGKARIIGSEAGLNYQWLPELNETLSTTLLSTKDYKTKGKLARRPNFNLRNNLNYNLGAKSQIEHELFYTGKRADVDNTGASVNMKDYLLNNLTYRYSFNNSDNCYIRVKNIFNVDYEEIYGFGNGGRAFTLGLNYQF